MCRKTGIHNWLTVRAAGFLSIAAAVLPLLGGCGSQESNDAFAIRLDVQSEALQGLRDVTGTVRLNTAVQPGTRAALHLFATRPVDLELSDERETTTASVTTDVLTYRILGIERGTYFLYVWVDSDGNGVRSAGDQEGYFEGSPASPNVCSATATPLVVRGSRQADFGVGTLAPDPC